MQRIQLCSQHFATLIQMVKVGTAEILTGITITTRIERRGIRLVDGVPDSYYAKGRKQVSIPGIACSE